MNIRKELIGRKGYILNPFGKVCSPNGDTEDVHVEIIDIVFNDWHWEDGSGCIYLTINVKPIEDQWANVSDEEWNDQDNWIDILLSEFMKHPS